jgi:phospholipid/cholesterol/gamma-HCH transport system ATP-binding protein
MHKIELKGVGYGFEPQRWLFHDVSFTVGPGEALVITGKSGCGKSVLLELCAGLRKPSAGRVLWDEVDLSSCTPPILMSLRRQVGFVFQLHALISNYTVYNNVALPLQYHLHLDENEIREQVYRQLRTFEVFEFKDKLPEALSAGQAKKAALARALIMEPRILFFDELTAGLDPDSIDTIISFLERVRMERKVSMIVTSHNSYVALQMRCPFAVLKDGELLWNEW